MQKLFFFKTDSLLSPTSHDLLLPSVAALLVQSQTKIDIYHLVIVISSHNSPRVSGMIQT